MREIIAGIAIITISSVLCISAINYIGLFNQSRAVETVATASISALDKNLNQALAVIDRQADGISDKTLVLLAIIFAGTLIIIVSICRKPHVIQTPLNHEERRIGYQCQTEPTYLPDYNYQYESR